jgi:putative DNA-invertase from lambdoid prophage Rac
MKQALIYTRFSPRPNAEDCKSNERQIERCLAYCLRRDLEVCGTYSDIAVSGKVLDRPELSLVIERLKPGMVLVVDACDRLARDMLVSLTIRHQVDKAGATIEFADGSMCDTTPEGKLFQNILAAFASFERDRIAARTSAGLKRKQAAGQWLGRPPVGYEVDPNIKQLVACEHEQGAMRTAKRLANESRSNTSEFIARRLTEIHGLFRGKPWSPRTIRKIIAGQDQDIPE